jgi:metacaspase-1
VMGLLLGSTATRDVTTLDTPRLLPPDLAAADISRRADLYRSEVSRSTEWPAPQCTVLLEAACQDNQTASDGRPDPSGHQNGAFTRALRNVWESATDYADLHAQIVRQLPPTQSPNRYWATGPDTAFDAQPPFTI